MGLKPAVPFSGKVENLQGEPVSNVKICFSESSCQVFGSLPGTLVAETDSNGQFCFSRMIPDKKYTLLIIANEYMGEISELVSTQDAGKTYTVTPRKKITIHFKNIDLLRRFSVQARYKYKTGDCSFSYGHCPSEWFKEILKSDTDATYELNNQWKGENILQIGFAGEVSYRFDSADVSPTLTIDMAEKLPANKRPLWHSVTLRLQTVGDDPLPKGTIRLDCDRGLGYMPEIFSIPVDGIITTNLLLIPHSSFEISPATLSGYSVSHSFTADSTNLFVNVPLTPAGGVVLTCNDENGKPVSGFHVYVTKRAPDQPDTRWNEHMQFNTSPDESNVCMVEPIGFEDLYRISISKHNFEDGTDIRYQSEWFSLSETNPVKEMTCILAREKRVAP